MVKYISTNVGKAVSVYDSLYFKGYLMLTSNAPISRGMVNYKAYDGDVQATVNKA